MIVVKVECGHGKLIQQIVSVWQIVRFWRARQAKPVNIDTQ